MGHKMTREVAGCQFGSENSKNIKKGPKTRSRGPRFQFKKWQVIFGGSVEKRGANVNNNNNNNKALVLRSTQNDQVIAAGDLSTNFQLLFTKISRFAENSRRTLRVSNGYTLFGEIMKFQRERKQRMSENELENGLMNEWCLIYEWLCMINEWYPFFQ